MCHRDRRPEDCGAGEALQAAHAHGARAQGWDGRQGSSHPLLHAAHAAPVPRTLWPGCAGPWHSAPTAYGSIHAVRWPVPLQYVLPWWRRGLPTASACQCIQPFVLDVYAANSFLTHLQGEVTAFGRGTWDDDVQSTSQPVLNEKKVSTFSGPLCWGSSPSLALVPGPGSGVH